MKIKIEVDIEDREHARAVAENLRRAAEDLPLGMSTATPRLSTLRARTSITIAQIGLAIALGGGCATSGVQWDDVPTATITAHALPELQADFARYVEGAAGHWNRLLVERGCEPPFAMGPEGHAIVLVPSDAWEYGSRDGYTDGDEIRLAGNTVPPQALLLHELGHAIGLDHVEGRSIMSEPIGLGIYPSDVEAAASAMGCL